jgi:RNA-binding protein
VHLGEKGLTEAVIAEIGRALAAHELIKVRAGGLERDAREAAFAEICARLEAQPVQHIGKVLVIYRAKPEAA